MGYFATPAQVSAAPGRATPLTLERITTALDSQGWRYATDEDGQVYGGWDGHNFYFLRMGRNETMLMVRGRWEARLPLGMDNSVLPVLNDWHQEYFFPKAFLVDFPDDGNSRVFTEVTIDCAHGITDDQLLTHIHAGIDMSLALFKKLNEAFPGLQQTEDDE